MEDLPNGAINLIFRFSSYPLAELIKPCIRIDNEDRRTSIKLGGSRCYHSKQDYNKMEEDFIQARVVGNRVRSYINKPVFNLTDIPMCFDVFFFEHGYSIADNVFFGMSRNDGRIIRKP